MNSKKSLVEKPKAKATTKKVLVEKPNAKPKATKKVLVEKPKAKPKATKKVSVEKPKAKATKKGGFEIPKFLKSSTPLSNVIKDFVTNSNSLYDAYENLLDNIDNIHGSINKTEEKEIIKKILNYYTKYNEDKMFDYDNISTKEYKILLNNQLFANIIPYINLIELSNKIYYSIDNISKIQGNPDDFVNAIKKINEKNKDEIDNLFVKRNKILEEIDKQVDTTTQLTQQQHVDTTDRSLADRQQQQVNTQQQPDSTTQIVHQRVADI